MHQVGIIGASGYAGVELIRILLGHPDVEIAYLGANTQSGKAIVDVYPHLRKKFDHTFSPMAAESGWSECSVIFTALPHGEAQKIVPSFLAKQKKVIDLSADYRLDANAVYGLPELGVRSKIVETQLLANPGCYPTASLLALQPLLNSENIDKQRIILDCKSGVSGAGRSLAQGSLLCEASESMHAYGLLGQHRHQRELENIIGVPIQFSPHLVPMKRGILASAYIPLKKEASSQEIWNHYYEYYEKETFVRLLPLGQWPKTANVTGSNFCDIGLGVDPRTNNLLVMSAIDNLVKGAAGQAIQNMNLMMQFPEDQALSKLSPIFP